MIITITTAATENYLYAMGSLIPAIANNIQKVKEVFPEAEVNLILVGNQSMGEWKERAIDAGIDDDWSCNVKTILSDKWRESEKYGDAQNLMLTQMRWAGIIEARKLNSDFMWILDADVIPPSNALLCSIQTIQFDQGWYDVAFCPYPSQGGGSYLGGFGSPSQPIFPDFLPEEREVPEELLTKYQRMKKAYDLRPSGKRIRKVHELQRKIEMECPPKWRGNPHKHNAEYGWRPRGWLDYVYPDMGQGVVAPISWTGFGCTLLSRKALAESDFNGYVGRGTEDLFLPYWRYLPKNIRTSVIMHCPVSHVLRMVDRKDKSKRELVLCEAYFEVEDPKAIGHLRRRFHPYYNHEIGEDYFGGENGEGKRMHDPIHSERDSI